MKMPSVLIAVLMAFLNNKDPPLQSRGGIFTVTQEKSNEFIDIFVRFEYNKIRNPHFKKGGVIVCQLLLQN